MAAAASALISGKISGEDAKGLLKGAIDALNKPIVTITWTRNPKRTSQLRVESVTLNVTTGLVLGGVALAMLYEAAAWFANAIALKGGASVDDIGDLIPDVTALVSANPVLWLVTDLFGAPVIDPSTGQQKSVQVPATFGAAFNLTMRNLVVGGPGTLSAGLVNLVGQLTNGNPLSSLSGGTATSSSSSSGSSTPAPKVMEPLPRTRSA